MAISRNKWDRSESRPYLITMRRKRREIPVRNTFFITTAIDYTNGAPHLGHAYEKVLADVIARYQRMARDGGSESVYLLTGVDQHGQKVQQSAAKEGIAPQAFVDGITAKFLALWEKLGVRYDGWAATTDERHKRCVRAILQRLWDERDPATGQSRWIYKDRRAGFYSVRQEQFLTDKERGPDGQFGPEWGEVEEREEENYYFRLAESRDWLLALLDRRTDFVTPAFRQAELRNAVEKLTGDLCISRPKARLDWGIEFPFDPEFVTYVWFDALVNYISFAPGDYDPAPGADLSEFRRWWPALHVIGKDILIPAHGVYWPIMLRALGFADDEIPPLLVHGWWNIGGAKMSKSVGNAVDPSALVDQYGAEALRYYLMSDIATGKDADFSEERLIQRYNTDLANSLGNLLNRTLNMAHKFRDGRLRRVAPADTPECALAFDAAMSGYHIHNALAAAIDEAVHGNQAVDAAAPWKLAKDPAQSEKLDEFFYHMCERLRVIAILISPVLPKAAHGIFDQLNWKMELSGQENRFRMADTTLGLLPDGHRVNAPVPLFPRIEVKAAG
jgi:methionyl-tRNA synthetase